MGWFSSAISFVSSAVSSAVSGIGSAFSSFATNIVPIIEKSISIVSQVIQVLGVALGVIKPQEESEDLGDRALQAAGQGIHPENFTTYDEYLAEIRSFELDPEKSKQFDAKTKQMAGVAIICKSIEEKFDMRENTAGYMAALVALNSNYFTAQRLENWIKSGVDMDKAIRYFDRDLNAPETIETEKKLVTLEADKNHGGDQQLAYDKLQEAVETIEKNTAEQS